MGLNKTVHILPLPRFCLLSKKAGKILIREILISGNKAILRIHCTLGLLRNDGSIK